MSDFSFRLPAIVELTFAQQIALDEPRPLLITGGPGSGKTVVSIFRYLNQIGQTRNVLFFTFNRTLMSSIKGTLRQKADILLPDLNEGEVENIIDNQIGSIHEWYGQRFCAALSKHDEHAISANFKGYMVNRGNVLYAELFIDEAQDLRPEVISSAYLLAEKVSCSADRSQDLQGHYKKPADDVIYEILNKYKETLRQGLTQNFRNTRQIFAFARNFVPHDYNVQEIELDELPNGDEPQVRSGLDYNEQLDLIFEIIKQNVGSNIGIIVHFKSHIIRIKEYLIQKGYSASINASEELSFSYYYREMETLDKEAMEARLRTPFILTYESCKGLEFDIVIMPFFSSADWALSNTRKDENGNPKIDANGNPKFLATPNHYYVAATRARAQLFILCSKIPGILSFIE